MGLGGSRQPILSQRAAGFRTRGIEDLRMQSTGHIVLARQAGPKTLSPMMIALSAPAVLLSGLTPLHPTAWQSPPRVRRQNLLFPLLDDVENLLRLDILFQFTNLGVLSSLDVHAFTDLGHQFYEAGDLMFR